MTAEAPIAPAVAYGRLIPVTVHFDDLDALGLLHNARYPLMVERAWTELWNEHGVRFDGDWHAAGDACNAVRELRIGYEAPVTVLLGRRHPDLRPGSPGAGPAGRHDPAAHAVDRRLQGRGPGTAAACGLTSSRPPGPAVRSTPAHTTSPHASAVTTQNDTTRLVACATPPIRLGAISPEV